MNHLVVITDEGALRLSEGEGGWTAIGLRAADSATCIAVDADDVYLGTRGDGAWKSDDGGRSWRRLDVPASDVFSLAVSPADGSVYAGCEPSGLFRSRDGGASWEELEALVELPSAPTWSFPPRPWTSHVSAVAPHPRDADLLLVGIELGGLMRSEDGGRSWQDHRPGAQRDVHALAWHPRHGDRAYQSGGGGAATTRDAGRTWAPADEGRDRHYCWGLAVDQIEADTWYVSASPGPRAAHGDERADAAIYRRRGDGPWERLAGGLPRPLDDMPYALATRGQRLFAGFRSGRIMMSDDHGDDWDDLRPSGEPLVGLRALVAPA